MNKIMKIKTDIQDKIWDFLHKEDGMGVVEIILITIVLITLVIVFKKQITEVVNSILGKMAGQANQV